MGEQRAEELGGGSGYGPELNHAVSCGMGESLLPIPYASSSMNARLTLHEFRAIFSLRVWPHVRRAIRYTRAYEQGMEACLILLQAAEDFRSELTKKDYANACIMTYGLLLSCLDCLDRWEEYLSVWDQIRTHTELESQFVAGAVAKHGKKMAPFILRETKQYVYVHFLYGHLRRRDLISRKLEKLRTSGKVGNLLHARREQLSEEEMVTRVAWLRRLLASG